MQECKHVTKAAAVRRLVADVEITDRIART
jgi:hypothetical protein